MAVRSLSADPYMKAVAEVCAGTRQILTSEMGSLMDHHLRRLEERLAVTVIHELAESHAAVLAQAHGENEALRQELVSVRRSSAENEIPAKLNNNAHNKGQDVICISDVQADDATVPLASTWSSMQESDQVNGGPSEDSKVLKTEVHPVDSLDRKDSDNSANINRKSAESTSSFLGRARKVMLKTGMPKSGSRSTLQFLNVWYTESMETEDLHRGGTCWARIVYHKGFESFFSAIILLNCATMGIEAHGLAKGGVAPWLEEALDISEHMFTALFTVELFLRLKVYGIWAFSPLKKSNLWNFFDAVLVIFIGLLFGYVLPALAALAGFDGQSSIIQTLSVLRSVRLLRLVRVVQRSPMFHEAWLLIRGLTESIRTLFWTCTVIFFITYIFAVFGLVLISKDLRLLREEARSTGDEEALLELDRLLVAVGGLDLLMATLIQLLTMDSWNALTGPIKKYLSLSWLYFYAYIALAVFVLMNLVTAIIVENAVTNSRMDEDQAVQAREKKKNQELKELEHLFLMMDADGNGTLSWDEFKASFDDPSMIKKWKLLDFEPEECREVFSLLDDGDGEIETQEFFDGLGRMKGLAQSKDMFRITKSIENLSKVVDGLLESSKLEDKKLAKRRKSRTTPRSCQSECGSIDTNSNRDAAGVPLESMRDGSSTPEDAAGDVTPRSPKVKAKKRPIASSPGGQCSPTGEKVDQNNAPSVAPAVDSLDYQNPEVDASSPKDIGGANLEMPIVQVPASANAVLNVEMPIDEALPEELLASSVTSGLMSSRRHRFEEVGEAGTPRRQNLEEAPPQSFPTHGNSVNPGKLKDQYLRNGTSGASL